MIFWNKDFNLYHVSEKINPEESSERHILVKFLDFKDDQSSKVIKSLIGDKNQASLQHSMQKLVVQYLNDIPGGKKKVLPKNFISS